jgi:alpha-mannosidase
MPYGFIEKAPDGLEEPAQQWVAASCGGAPVFALINDGKYSFSMKGGTLRMTAVRTPGYADHFGKRDGLMEYTDQGIGEFKYSMLPCRAGYPEIVRAARLLNQPPEFVVETYHKGALPASWSGIAISSPDVIAEAFKRSEDGDGYVLRLFEASGRPARGVRVDCPAAGRSFECDFGPQEIKTLLLPDDAGGPVSERLISELGAYIGE